LTGGVGTARALLGPPETVAPYAAARHRFTHQPDSVPPPLTVVGVPRVVPLGIAGLLSHLPVDLDAPEDPEARDAARTGSGPRESLVVSAWQQVILRVDAHPAAQGTRSLRPPVPAATNLANIVPWWRFTWPPAFMRATAAWDYYADEARGRER